MRPFGGSDPQLIGINSNMHSLTTRIESLERTVNENQFLLTDLQKKTDQQTRILELLAEKLGIEKLGDKLA